MRSWVIGSSTECDVVVDSPLASARHCQLTDSSNGFMLNDLGSTNGTYVNGVRIAGPICLTRGDSITLGRTVPFVWPRELTTSIPIGRLTDNDIVLDDPRVSGHHARLIIVAGFQTLIEDLGSSNGTFLNSPDRRVTGPTPIAESDTLYFGALAIPASRILTIPAKSETPGPLLAPPAHASQSKPTPIPNSALFERLNTHRWLLGWAAQTPVLAGVIMLSFTHQPAATTFALALAAIWLGGSLAAGELAAGRSPVRPANADPSRFYVSSGTRIVGLAVLCSVASTAVLAFVDWGSGLKGPWLPMWGVIVMTSLAGLFFGLAVSALVRNWASAAAVLLIGFAAMTALGGYLQPVANMKLPVRMLATAMPSRWAFEGLFLLETAHDQAVPSGEESESAENHDIVEAYFPARSERMGPTADALALGSILIALAALTVFISGFSRTDPGTLSGA